MLDFRITKALKRGDGRLIHPDQAFKAAVIHWLGKAYPGFRFETNDGAAQIRRLVGFVGSMKREGRVQADRRK